MKPDVQLTEQEHAYIVQVLMSRPISEALPLFLKLTGQVLRERDPQPDKASAS